MGPQLYGFDGIFVQNDSVEGDSYQSRYLLVAHPLTKSEQIDDNVRYRCYRRRRKLSFFVETWPFFLSRSASCRYAGPQVKILSPNTSSRTVPYMSSSEQRMSLSVTIRNSILNLPENVPRLSTTLTARASLPLRQCYVGLQ